MDRIGTIRPEYVWITSGTGRWTNEKSAQALAQRRAGIDTFKLIDVFEILKTPFTLIGKEEFLERSKGDRYAYMYGKTAQAEEDEALNGEISVINTDLWSSIYFNIYSGDKRVIPFSEKEVISAFEQTKQGLSPTPLTRVERVVRDDYKTNYCVLIAAMVIGEPYERNKSRASKPQHHG